MFRRNRKNDLQDLMEIMLESLMVSELREYFRKRACQGTSATATVPGGHTGMAGH